MGIRKKISDALRHTMLSSAVAGILISPTVVMANSINALTLTTDTLEALPSCLHYQVVGVCFWLVCVGPACTEETTPKVDHYLPDVVVTVYPKYKTDPWFLVNHTIDVVDHSVGNEIFKILNQGMQIEGGAMNSAGSNDSNIKLREVDVIGNPALTALHSHYLLKGQATPMMPYYQSQLDADEWRSGLLEQLYPQSWIPGYEDVGTFLVDEWGSVYPRQGFLMQANVGKASAVYAVRAGNIATTASYDHVAMDLAASLCPEEGCTTAGPILSDTPKTEWQMVLPNPQTVCHAKIDYSAHPGWTVHQPDSQTYSWIVWREYRGCIQGKGIYLGST